MTILKSIGYSLGTAGVVIAAVVAAPVAGAVGTITLAGACIAGGSGALVGGAASFFDDTEKEAYKKGHNDGTKTSKATADIELEQMRENLKKYHVYTEGCSGYFNSIVTLNTVAASAISQCNEVSASERAQLELFLMGSLASELPEDITNKINSIFDIPVAFTEAYELAMNSQIPMDVYDDVIRFALAVAGANDDDVALISQAWSQLKAA